MWWPLPEGRSGEIVDIWSHYQRLPHQCQSNPINKVMLGQPVHQHQAILLLLQEVEWSSKEKLAIKSCVLWIVFCYLSQKMRVGGRHSIFDSIEFKICLKAEFDFCLVSRSKMLSVLMFVFYLNENFKRTGQRNSIFTEKFSNWIFLQMANWRKPYIS